MSGLYIHIPFCSGKCHYCDFVSSLPNGQDVSNYLNALKKEAVAYSKRNFNTLYIGGGTPSELSVSQLKKLFKTIETNFKPVKKFNETTFEANPESLTTTKINLLKKYGVTRVSLGLQTTNNNFLKQLGRRHNFKKFLSVYSELKKSGFQNISIDLISGLRGQTLYQAKKDVNAVIKLNPTHISLYSLQIEPGTLFYKQKISTNDTLAAKIYESTRKQLKSFGYIHYEISNFTKSGFECRHNLNYWNNGSYLGLGLSAASYLNGERKSNTTDFKQYCKNPLKNFTAEKLKGKEKIGETLILGLRKIEGTKLTKQVEKYFSKEIDKLLQQKLINLKKGHLALTKKGLLLANIVFRNFVRPFY